jgi:uncharacterized membrane protein
MLVIAMAPTTESSPGAELPNAGVCYVFGVLFPLLYLLAVSKNRQNPLLRFHSIQCLLLFVVLTPLFYFQRGSLGRFSSIAFLVCIVAWFTALVQAARRKRFHIPLIGLIAERLA